MGHLIEYYASVPEPSVRRWLDRLNGSYCSDPGDMLSSWEGNLRSGGTFWAYMAPHACNFVLGMKYSGLYFAQQPAVDFAQRFEAEFWEQFDTVPLLRVDEFRANEWYRAVDREWEDYERPVEEFLAWLQSHADSHWHWLTPDARTADPGTAPDPQVNFLRSRLT